MTNNISTRAAALLAPTFLASALCGASTFASTSEATRAQSTVDQTTLPTQIAPLVKRGVAHDEMMWDAPGDGSIWARGKGYKTSFDASGATYYPAFGARAPHNMPHALSPDVVTLGGAPIAFEHEVFATRDGDRAQFERGAFTEVYDLAPGSMEQSFVFGALPRSGDLVLHIPVASELAASQTDAGIEFSGEFGRVTYGRATAIDAAGHRANAATSIVDGAITIRVDQDFLAHATLPLVVDPVVASFYMPGTTSDDFSADTAFDTFDQLWLVVYEETYSATDTDVYAEMHSTTGALLGTQTVIDFTTNKWEKPRVAYNTAAQQFLVVAAVTTGTTTSIQARAADPNGALLTTGTQFIVSGPDSGAKTDPDVGADSFGSGTTYYCVAYTRTNPSGWTEIGISMILPNQGFGPAYYLSGPNILFSDSQVSVSKSNGGDQFLVAFRRYDSGNKGDIFGAHISYLGGILDGPFSITSDLSFDALPCASSPINGTHRNMVSFQRNALFSTNHDIMVSALDGTTVLSTVDLNTLEGTGLTANDQIEPSIDCDGAHFVVAYSEYIPLALFYEEYADDLYLAGSTIGLSQTHVVVPGGLGLSQRRVNVAAARSTNSHRYAIVYDIEGNSTDHDAWGQLFDSTTGGSASTYCFGDGTGTACPCGNSGGIGRGCANSVNAAGAYLSISSGSPSTLNDNVVIVVSGVPSTVSCLFFQGTALSPISTFGDGLRCATGSIVRLATKAAVGGVASYPQLGDLSITAKGGITADGGTRGYQVWYRNAASFCTASTFNLSNGLRIDWAR